MSKQDFYTLLGVAKSASDAEIKAAYRKKAFEFHPDRNQGDQKAEDMFKLVAEAYDVLSDPQKRGIYDQFGHAGLQGGGGGFGGGFSNAEDVFSAFGDIFEDFFGFGGGSSGRGRTRARRGKDLQTELEIEFLDACFGTKKEVNVTSHDACQDCHGSGVKKGSQPSKCNYCGGHGQVRMTQGFFTINTTCPQCSGQGQIIKDKCHGCHGSGLIKKNRKLQVKVPAGVTDGMRLLMQGEGEAGQNGGPKGDLYVFIHVKQHAEFHRQDDNIITELKVSFPELALGAQLNINTIDGDTSLDIKAGTQSGEIVKLKGRGVANVRTGRRGDHLIHLQAITPDKLTAKQKELFQQLSVELGASSQASDTKQKKKKKSIFGMF